MKESTLIKKAFTFFLLALLFSLIFCGISILVTKDHRINILAYALGVPFTIMLLKGKEFAKIEDIKKNKKWLLIALITPFAYTTVLYLLGKYVFPFSPDPLDQNQNILYQTVFILLSVIFEEIGWRGYLYKYFTMEGWFKMNLSISFFWALWHLPAILYGGYTIPGPFWIGVILFFVNLTLASFMLGWIRQKTGGILAPTLVHAGNNIAMILFGISGPLLNESGIIFTIILAGFVFFTKAWKTPTLFQLNVLKQKYLG
ncbi:MAG: CPBP family intramembrane glutamic endopeptidase [Candidatus Gracilibacteria bacterium]